MLTTKGAKGYESGAFTFVISTKVTKSLGPKPPKAEKPDGIPKIRKLAMLRQYGFFYGISPGFSPAERFFRQWPWGYGGTGYRGTTLWGHNFFKDKGGGTIRLFFIQAEQYGGTGGRYA